MSRLKGALGSGNATMGDVSDTGQKRRTVRADDSVWIPAKDLAERLGETISDVVRESLVGYLELHTDPTWAEAMAVAAEHGDDLRAIIRQALVDYVAGNERPAE